MSLWTSKFGDDYTRRNIIDVKPHIRKTVWDNLLPDDVRSVLEVGANVGLNLEAISQLNDDIELMACEPNAEAMVELQNIVPRATADMAHKLSFPDGIADLVFTCGVLIHIPTDKLRRSMAEIHRCARNYIICGEYFAPQEEMIPYRGELDALWRRDYGSLYLDAFPDLRCISTLFCWKRMTGLDNVTFWVFEKGPRRH